MKNGSSSPLLSKKEWIPDSQRRNCSLCDVKFSFSTRKHHCRWCGEVVCASCSKKRVKMEGTPRRICNTCFEKEFPSKRPASENVQKSLSPQQLKEKEVPKTPKHPQLPQVEKPLLLDRAYVFFSIGFHTHITRSLVTDSQAHLRNAPTTETKFSKPTRNVVLTNPYGH